MTVQRKGATQIMPHKQVKRWKNLCIKPADKLIPKSRIPNRESSVVVDEGSFERLDSCGQKGIKHKNKDCE